MTNFEIIVTDENGQMDAITFRTDDPIPAFEVRGFKHTGHAGGAHLRPELQSQPKFYSLHGPMWNGLKDGEPVNRYEDARAYETLST